MREMRMAGPRLGLIVRNHVDSDRIFIYIYIFGYFGKWRKLCVM